MSPIIDLQRGISEAGRIRIGQQVPAGNGRTRPSKLETFRLTSSDRKRIDQAAELYGGTVSEWQAPAGKQWQVITATDALDVIVPPSDLSFSQHYELWSAGGAQRRCDGVTEMLGEQPCLCDPAARECDIHTRLSVMLRDLPGLGVWRIDTQGYYAAVELSGAVQIISLAAGRGALLPARLRLEQRSVKRPDAKGKPQTLRFAVPVLDIEVTPAQLLSGGAEPIQLADATQPRMTPVPQLALAVQPSIAEQSAPPAARTPRKNAAPEIPSSGRTRRTEQAGSPAEVAAATDGEGAAGARPAPSPTEQPTARAEAGATQATPARTRRSATAAAAAKPASAPIVTRPRSAKGEPAYWNDRVHALADEKGIDHEGLRVVAAAVCGIDAGALTLPESSEQRFSVTQLVDAEWEAIDNLLRPMARPLDVEAGELGNEVFRVAVKHGLADWPDIDLLATAATGKQPGDLTSADWIALMVRMAAGEYDQAEAKVPAAAGAH
jgi:hypothetical protein